MASRSHNCTLAETTDCKLTHPSCVTAGECQGHTFPVCTTPARYRLEGPDVLQYACADHVDIQLRRFPGATIKREN